MDHEAQRRRLWAEHSMALLVDVFARGRSD